MQVQFFKGDLNASYPSDLGTFFSANDLGISVLGKLDVANLIQARTVCKKFRSWADQILLKNHPQRIEQMRGKLQACFEAALNDPLAIVIDFEAVSPTYREHCYRYLYEHLPQLDECALRIQKWVQFTGHLLIEFNAKSLSLFLRSKTSCDTLLVTILTKCDNIRTLDEEYLNIIFSSPSTPEILSQKNWPIRRLVLRVPETVPSATVGKILHQVKRTLTSLDVSYRNNKENGDIILGAFCELQSLEELQMVEPYTYTPSKFAQLGTLPRLNSLTVHCVEHLVDGPLIDFLQTSATNQQLQQLSIIPSREEYNPIDITDRAVPAIANMIHLKSLTIWANKITEEGRSTIYSRFSGCRFSLYYLEDD